MVKISKHTTTKQKVSLVCMTRHNSQHASTNVPTSVSGCLLRPMTPPINQTQAVGVDGVEASRERIAGVDPKLPYSLISLPNASEYALGTWMFLYMGAALLGALQPHN